MERITVSYHRAMSKIFTKRIMALATAYFLLACSFLCAASEWKEYKCQHLIIYYKQAPEDFVKSVEQMAEYYYDEISKNMGYTRYKGWTWDERAKIYIYDNADDYVASSQQANWSHGVASPQDKVIRTFPSAHGFFDSTLPHELGHIVFREIIGFKAQVPLWFEEGVATQQETAKRWGAHDTVRKFIEEGKFIPLDELSFVRLNSKTDPERVNLFYAESASAVNYLISEFGLYRFVNLCRKLEEGGPFEWALEAIYVRFKNLKEFNKSWVDYLKKK